MLAAHGGDARPLAGGQSLVPLLNFRLARPAVLVDLNRIEALSRITVSDGALCIGAMARQAAVEADPDVARGWPLLTEAIGHIAHPQIRNRGTVGGSLAHNDPAAELPAVMLALDAEMTAQGPQGQRIIAAGDFFAGTMETALAPDELLTEIAVPALPEGTGWGFQEAARRQGDFALVAVAVLLRPTGSGRSTRASWSPGPETGPCACVQRRLSWPSGERTAKPARRWATPRPRPAMRRTTPTRPPGIGRSSWRRSPAAPAAMRRCGWGTEWLTTSAACA